MTTKSGSPRATGQNRKDPAVELAPLVLPESLDQRFARELRPTLVTLVTLNRPCQIDGRNVRKSSTACLQLLTAFARVMGREGLLVTLCKPSNTLLKNLELLGLAWPTVQLELEN